MIDTTLVLERDLFFVAKIRETLKAAGRACVVVKTLADWRAHLAADTRPQLALVHFGMAGVEWQAAIAAAKDAGLPVLAFGSHVDLAAQAEARTAGATRVIANSKLATDMIGQFDQTIARQLGTMSLAADTDAIENAGD